MELEDGLVLNKFRVLRNSGIACGKNDPDIFIGLNVETNHGVLIKREELKAKHPRLLNESKMYRYIENGAGIPYHIRFAIEGDYNFLVMSLLGRSLEQLFNICNGKFTLKTVLMLAFQMIDRVEFIHSRSVMHRDIRPENFLMGFRQQGNQVFVTGFGFSKHFRVAGFTHIPYRENKCMVGTARYSSIRTLSGIEQSRRDDLESLGYVLMYFLRGSLPWQGVEANNKREKFEKIRQMKCLLRYINVLPQALCEGYPSEFIAYFKYCRSLRFNEKPDYVYLKRIFRELFTQEGFELDYDFDWKSNQIPIAAHKDAGDIRSIS